MIQPVEIAPIDFNNAVEEEKKEEEDVAPAGD